MHVLDFTLRLAFFAFVPFLATYVSALFPMTPVLINVALTLAVFAAAEGVRERAERSWLVARLVKRRLLFEAHYRENPPQPFAFYVLYPIFLPYVLARPALRRELWLYRGLTGGGVVVLIVAAGIDFARNWQPHLGFEVFAWRWIFLLGVQTLSIFVFLMPVATTVVELHLEKRTRALWLLLGVAAISVSVGVGSLVAKRRHIVSWVTRERVSLRTEAAPAAAKAAQAKALSAVWNNFGELRESTDADGWVEGDALDRAEEHLGLFYKPDEAYAFSLHAYPANAPEVLVLQCRRRRGAAPIWFAVKRSGQEVLSPTDLPKGVLGAQRQAPRRPPVKRTTGPRSTH